MSKRRVLAISSDLDQLRRIVASLERAGAVVDAARSVHSIAADLVSHRYVFAGIDAGDRTALAYLLSKLRASAHVTVVTEQAPLEDLFHYLEDERVNHVVVGDALDEGVCITASKLLSGDLFGIEKYLPADAQVQYLRLHDFEGRSRAIDTVLAYAESARFRRQTRTAIGQVCEELLMNALYDAPVDEQGRQIFADVDPHARVGIGSPRPVSIRYAATEDQFAIAVRDRFGRLAKSTILAYIDKCLRATSAEEQIDRKTYGAGLGLYMVANATATYVVNVAHDVATEVVCTFDRTPRTPLRQVGVFVHPFGAELLRPMTQSGALDEPAAPAGSEGNAAATQERG
ncbi:MAG: hypothetical protein IPI49_06285 [Myxococcales bacterium]|nr:hypothetical protein [Myxococcales bacterium]